MRFRFRYYPFYLLLAVCLASSCTSYKKVPYLQSTDEGSPEAGQLSLYQGGIIRFQPDDVIGITVNTVEEQALAADFNLPFQPAAHTDNAGDDIIPQGYGRQTYQVDKNGEIDFPVLGKIKVRNLTKDELEAFLKRSLSSILKEAPIVTVRMLNFRISVTGEVGRPGQYSVSKDRIHVIEALALAGDMTIYGERDKVKLMREMPNGELKIVYLDISRDDVVSSPYFYLQQNDVIYVQPNKARARSADIGSQTSIIISLGSMLLTLANLIIVISK